MVISGKGNKLEEQLSGVQQKMNGILNVIQGTSTVNTNSNTNTNEFEEERI